MTKQNIIIGALGLFVVLSIAFDAYSFMALRKHASVINAQGQIIFFMMQTPEINAVITKEWEKRKQGGSNTASSTPETDTKKEK